RPCRAVAKPTHIGQTALRWRRIAMWPSSRMSGRTARLAADTGSWENELLSRTPRSNGTKEIPPDTGSSSSELVERSIATYHRAESEQSKSPQREIQNKRNRQMMAAISRERFLATQYRFVLSWLLVAPRKPGSLPAAVLPLRTAASLSMPVN